MSEALLPWVEGLALRVYEGLNCAKSLQAAILLRYKEWRQLAEMRVSPSDYADSDTFLRAYQACELLRKYPGLPLGIDTAAAALASWEESERQCYLTNERLSPYLWRAPECDERIMSVLDEVRKEVTKLIGFRPGPLAGSFGPGATVSDPAVRCTIPDKLTSPVSLTFEASSFVIPWSGTHWYSARREACISSKEDLFRFSHGNVWFCVPKDATVDRSCAKEPSLNAFYQRGAGLRMGERLLRKAGIDIKTRPEWHQFLAEYGSLDGSLSTIDLKSASDTVSINLVKLMLPDAWFECLDALRSKKTFVKGSWRRLEKFSSMGNGFTFELETVLFLALARVACRNSVSDDRIEQEVSTFGDDIVVPTEAARDVMSLLAFVGLTPNKRKTFVDGEFRESCGGDFFRGRPVRPYLLKDIPDDTQSLISIANGLRRVSRHFGDERFNRLPLFRSWLYCLDWIPTAVRSCRGPEDLGDLVIHDDERWWRVRWRSQIRYLRVYRPIGRRTVRFSGFGREAQLAAALYLAGNGGKPLLDHRGNLASRQDVQGFKIGWTARS